MSGTEPAGSATSTGNARSLKRFFAMLVLLGEVLVVGFAALVAKDLSDVDGATLGWTTLAVAVACLLAAGSLRWRVGYLLGWLVQVLLVASGVWVPMMFALGLGFGALWFAALLLGGRADVVT